MRAAKHVADKTAQTIYIDADPGTVMETKDGQKITFEMITDKRTGRTSAGNLVVS